MLSLKTCLSAVFCLLTALCVIIMPSAFANEIARFESLKAQLIALGIPHDGFVENYLTAELFYNIHTRAVVARSITDIQIKNIDLSISQYHAYTLKAMFPNWEKVKIHSSTYDIQLKGIKITGHDSYFVWAPEQPDIYFIWKKKGGPYKTDIGLQLFDKSASRMTDLQLDFAIERGLQNDVIRQIKTHKLKPGEQIYPLHGFLGSPLLTQLASKWGLTRFEFLKEKLMPHYADILFETVFRVGVWPNSHTQNLWIIIDDKNNFRLAHKDFQHLIVDPFLRHTDPTYPYEIGRRDTSDFKEVNSTQAVDSPRASEPSFNFVEYAFQTIIYAADMSLKERAQVFKAFLKRFIERINAHYNIQIHFSEHVQSTFDSLEQFSHEYDIRGFTVWTTKGLFSFGGHLYGLAERIMREIHSQVYANLLGIRTYPQDKRTQSNLDLLYASGTSSFALAPKNLPLALTFVMGQRGDMLKNIKNLMLDPFVAAVNKTQGIIANFDAHYEFTPHYILLVTRNGKILSAKYIEDVEKELKKLDPLFCESRLRNPIESLQEKSVQ